MSGIRKFLKDESGVETLEWLAILAVGAILIAIAYTIGKDVKEKMENAGSDI